MSNQPDHEKTTKNRNLAFARLVVLSFLIWLLLSGRFELKFILMGIFFSILSSVLCLPFIIISNPVSGKKYYLFNARFFRLIAYYAWLFLQILLAGLDVVKATLKKELVEPSVMYFCMPYENPIASALLTDSIILTPGTITLSVSDDGVFEVHALTKNAREGLMDGTMQKKIAHVYDEECEFIPYPERTRFNIPKEVQ